MSQMIYPMNHSDRSSSDRSLSETAQQNGDASGRDTMTAQAALRIALAARQLPGIDVRALLGLLIQHLSAPLSEEKLLKLSPKAFRLMVSSIQGGPGRKETGNAYAVLTQTQPEAEPPRIKAVEPLAAPKLYAAVTSNQGEMIDGHYGSCLNILVYEVNRDSYQLIDIRPVERHLQGEVRSQKLLELIHDCQILFTLSIGGPAAAKVTRADVHPIKRATPTEAGEVMTELSQVICNSPPPWLRKQLGLPPDFSAWLSDDAEAI
ncbi:dinitrogenase iron-molybdenum cofactor biosynthesis protein [Vibrio mangrovi]|uniref:Dinitrogenase iron-molybdenum cofactor n=1 Tax=Vibrio mangrovi TaxID=474394 RepID=A0A1Y6IRR3_9VIBR|nr:dinitrogenase iron-molybdenum cofactor biosynthesis protein [Vibrio mangrovi]MDW6004011.1 dinitrogenase iron-molybdenum cofactor biosynthesis protein [Vibrio mangrovi]SMR99192.1 Dinitrogenase iron-molybdenum cofactor [Vibrio mangrovi]